jgi:hypothetical protein
MSELNLHIRAVAGIYCRMCSNIHLDSVLHDLKGVTSSGRKFYTKYYESLYYMKVKEQGEPLFSLLKPDADEPP